MNYGNLEEAMMTVGVGAHILESMKRRPWACLEQREECDML